jgi:primosomal replication protein N
LRYTPAGLPAVDLTLRHDRATVQLGQPRQLRFEMHAKAVGPVAEELLAQELGSEAAYEGFLGAHRNGRGIVFHVESFALSIH